MVVVVVQSAVVARGFENEGWNVGVRRKFYPRYFLRVIKKTNDD